MPTKTRSLPKKPAAAPIPVDQLEDGKVQVTLSSGVKLTIKEPKVKQFLLMDSWLKDEDSQDFHSDVGTVLKLTHSCITEMDGEPFHQSFDEWTDNLDVRDMEVVGAALSRFQSFLDYLAEKSQGASN